MPVARGFAARARSPHTRSGSLWWRRHTGGSAFVTLLNRRTLIVTGKGGVGKTTVCVALGLAVAAQAMEAQEAGVHLNRRSRRQLVRSRCLLSMKEASSSRVG